MILFEVVIVVLFFCILVLVVLLLLSFPDYIRNWAMKRLAEEYGLSYDGKQNLLAIGSVYKDRHFINGSLGGHQIAVYDSFVTDKLLFTWRKVKVLVDGKERDIFAPNFIRPSAQTSTSEIRKFLDRVKSGNS